MPALLGRQGSISKEGNEEGPECLGVQTSPSRGGEERHPEALRQDRIEVCNELRIDPISAGSDALQSSLVMGLVLFEQQQCCDRGVQSVWVRPAAASRQEVKGQFIAHHHTLTSD